MAIADIVERIASDAAAEVAEIIGAAEVEGQRIAADTASRRSREREHALERAMRDAAGEAATMLANERLAVRDALLTARGRHVEAVLALAVEALGALPDAEYLDLIARKVATLARGGERLAVAAADATRLAPLAERLRESGINVTTASESAPIERGVVLTGDRVRIEVSPASLVAERRDQLAAVAASALFAEEG